jgi:hypothetical protein
MAPPRRQGAPITAKLGKSDISTGALLPGTLLAKGMVRNFERQLNTKPTVRALYKRNPNRALAAYGFSEDFRRELLRDSALRAKDSCWVTCIKTCWCTNCCCTANTIVITVG